MLKRRIGILSVVLILPLVLAACGNSSTTAAEAADIVATEAPAAEAPAAEAPAVVAAPTEAPVEETVAESSTAVETVAEAPTAEAPAAEAPVAAVTRTFVATAGGGSTAQYAVEEEFFGQNVPFVTAVGTTDQVDGSITLEVSDEGVAVVDGSFHVNLSTLTSDQGRRDNAIRRDWLQSNTYPDAYFTNITAVNLPAEAAERQEVAFQLSGDLTVREIAQPVTWNVTAKVENGTLTGTATTFVMMADYGFEAPNIGGMLKVTDGVTLTLTLVATEQ